ncbi:hypothetical protein FQN54_001053 [Arachnomyces sp. PD_36]|nr:hypothetical protein FQN54_001053 [Arachnomyces sp. PD_36]
MALPSWAATYAILGTTPDGISASRSLDAPGGCFNFDDPNVLGSGDAVLVFSHLSDTYTSSDAGLAGAWLYRDRDCHDAAPMFVDASGYTGLNPPLSFASCKLEAGK